MKIAFIGQKGIPSLAGGIEKHVEEVAVRMAKEGHEVFVYVRDNYTPKELKEFKGVNLIHLPSINTKHLDAISHTFLASLHSLFSGYDVIHYHGIGPSILSWIPKFFTWKTPIIATFHCQDYYHQKWGVFARFSLKLGEFLTCTVPDKTIVVSKALKIFSESQYKNDAVLIPNGSDIRYSEQVDAISKWGLRDKKYILVVGRLIKHKGVHYLIDAFKQLEDTSKIPNNFKLVIVGDGFHTDDYVHYLHTISEGRDNIIFTGMQTGEALEQLFSHAYLFVQPSESEGMSIALLEAMGYGLMPIVSDIEANMEVVEDENFSFPSKSIVGLRDKLAYFLNRSDEVEKFGKMAKLKIEQEYSWDSIVQKTIEVYKGALSKYE